MKLQNKLTTLLLAAVLFSSCKKQDNEAGDTQAGKTQLEYRNIKIPDNFFKPSPVPGVAEAGAMSTANAAESNNIPLDLNNGDDPVILGQQLANPYSIPNMQQAYLQLYGSTASVPVTHLYIRYKPATQEQLSGLLAQPGLELQDYPMDYEVLQEGDYYPDPTLDPEEIGWLYAAVPVPYTPVSGIQYEMIQQLHIPPNDDLLLEGMAESIAAGAVYQSIVIESSRLITRKDEPSDPLIVPEGYWSLMTGIELPPVECPFRGPIDDCDVSGGGGGGGGGGSPDPNMPQGAIQVQEQRTCNANTPVVNMPVRQARIVCKRWFKIWTGYTDEQGRFTAGKRFRNKVKVVLKTENNNAKVAKVRGVRVWQILFPVKKRIGVFDQGAMAAVNYLFTKPRFTNAGNKDLAYWVAVTTHNNVLEYRQYATEAGIAAPPGKMNILVTNWGVQTGAGAAPLWNKCSVLASELTTLQAFVQYFIVQPVALVSIGNMVQTLKKEVDIVIGYAAPNDDYECLLTSSLIRALVYHELGHASHFAQAGCDYWQVYRTRISNEICCGDPSTRPYGNGTETNAGIVAVGEMWGSHCEKIFSERHYANPVVQETFSVMQKRLYVNAGSPIDFYAGVNTSKVTGLNANFAAIESFDPNIALSVDQHRWMPLGLCYDLFDNRNDRTFEFAMPVDNVAGYTMQQCFNALQSNVRSIPAFRDRLLLQNGNNQQVQVNVLFNAYNY